MDHIIIELMKNAMKNKNLTQQMLCQGICDETTISRYFTNKREPDRLTFNALLQRLNISSDTFITIQSAEEYDYFQHKTQLLQAINGSDWEQVKKELHFLESFKKKATGINSILQQQFIIIIYGILSEELEHKTDNAISHFKKALCLTHNDYSDLWPNTIVTLMCNQEWCALLNLLSLTAHSNINTLQDVAYYLEKNQLVEQQQAKIFPYVIYLLATCYFNEGRYQTCEKKCENAIFLLRENCILSVLPELMDYSIRCKKLLNKEEDANTMQCQLDALHSILHTYSRNTKWLLMPMMDNRQVSYIYGNLIVQKRKHLGISQKDLCNKICSISSLKNIERGKGIPSKYILHQLLKRLELPTSFFNGEILTANLQVLDIHHELKKLITGGNTNEIKHYLNDLAIRLDQSICINAQWIQYYQGIVDWPMQRIENNTTYIERILSILKQSIPNFSVKLISTYLLTDVEIQLIIQLAITYTSIKDYDYAIIILEELLIYYEKQNPKLKYFYKKEILVTYNLAICYVCKENYDHAIGLIDSMMQQQITNNYAFFLPRAIMEIAYVQKKLQHTPEAKKHYKIAALLGELFFQEDTSIPSWKQYHQL